MIPTFKRALSTTSTVKSCNFEIDSKTKSDIKRQNTEYQKHVMIFIDNKNEFRKLKEELRKRGLVTDAAITQALMSSIEKRVQEINTSREKDSSLDDTCSYSSPTPDDFF